MTIAEIKSILPPVAVWMAKQAIMEGIKAYHKAQEQYSIEETKQKAGKPYDYTLAHAYNEGMKISAEILWKLFASCSADCQRAIAEVAKKRDGYCGYPENYFDDFVNALERVQGHSVYIRVTE